MLAGVVRFSKASKVRNVGKVIKASKNSEVCKVSKLSMVRKVRKVSKISKVSIVSRIVNVHCAGATFTMGGGGMLTAQMLTDLNAQRSCQLTYTY